MSHKTVDRRAKANVSDHRPPFGGLSGQMVKKRTPYNVFENATEPLFLCARVAA